jgi:hypothetical protein
MPGIHPADAKKWEGWGKNNSYFFIPFAHVVNLFHAPGIRFNQVIDLTLFTSSRLNGISSLILPVIMKNSSPLNKCKSDATGFEYFIWSDITVHE